jgi:hypothetical protein
MSRTVTASFGAKNWPPDIYPGSYSKGRRLLRLNQIDLIRAGALARVGRELVVFVEPYTKWLQKQGAAVAGYECPANRDRSERISAVGETTASTPGLS